MIKKRKKEAEKMALNGIVSIEVTRFLVQEYVHFILPDQEPI
jgi:hypothetical protein